MSELTQAFVHDMIRPYQSLVTAAIEWIREETALRILWVERRLRSLSLILGIFFLSLFFIGGAVIFFLNAASIWIEQHYGPFPPYQKMLITAGMCTLFGAITLLIGVSRYHKFLKRGV